MSHTHTHAHGSNEHGRKGREHISHIRERLQKEVDLILAKVDDSTLFAEFRQEEIMDLRNADEFEAVKNTLDERIMVRYNMERASIASRNAPARAQSSQRQQTGKLSLSSLIYFLFKRLEY